MALKATMSVLLVLIFGYLGTVWSQMLLQLRGISGAQILNNDSVVDNAVSLAFRTGGDYVGLLLFVIPLLLLLAIWWSDLKKVWAASSTMTVSQTVTMVAVFGALISLLLLAGCDSTRGSNDSERNKSADIVEIQPNQSAFVIPATGGNLSAQAQFDSIDYLTSKKVASKRVILEKTNQGQRWVTNEIVVLVTRTPVARQWTKAHGTGTGEGDQSLCGESIESIEVCFQIAVSAEIQEKDAATYLYHYPTAKLNDKQLGSVYEARPLDSLVDNQVHNYLLAYLAEQLATRKLDDILTQKVAIVNKGSDQTKAYFATRGITIDHLGMGGELIMPPAVQDVINRKYVSEKEMEISTNLATAYDNYQSQKGMTDAAAVRAVYNALGGNGAAVGAALEGYRWNGDRTTTRIGSDTPVAIGVNPTAR